MSGLSRLAIIAKAAGYTATPGTKLPNGETIMNDPGYDPNRTTIEELKGKKPMAKKDISSPQFMQKVRPLVAALSNSAQQMTTEADNMEAVHTVEAQLAAAELHINKLKELYANHNVTKIGGSILM